MATPTKSTLLNFSTPIKETAMEKTSRAVKEILDDEAEKRELRTARLRKARLEREAGTPSDKSTAKPKKPSTKAAK